MKIIEVKDYQQMSKRAADYIIEKVIMNPNISLGLATGGTPMGTYQNLIKDFQMNGTSYKKVTTFNLDEYVGLSGENRNSYRHYMNDQLFNHLDINKAKTYVPSGDAADIQKECIDYEELIAEHGGVDLQVLGIGENGHIGFNEPGTSFQSKTHIVKLESSTISANSRYFERLEDVPTEAITMGISTIMKSKEILLLISGENKREAMSELLSCSVNESFPASVLKNHPCVTIIADEAAVANLKVHC